MTHTILLLPEAEELERVFDETTQIISLLIFRDINWKRYWPAISSYGQLRAFIKRHH